MALFRKILRGSEARTVQQKTKRLQREAVRKREDPTLYQVKMKLKNHQDPKYSTMSDEELTREATHLTDHEALKEFFKDLTHEPVNRIMEEVAAHASRDESFEEVRQKHLDRVGQLTLKLHLSHLEETPSHMARLGAILFKVPYGMLRAALEIRDSSNPNISYIVEFNESSLVQPRKKNRLEESALEATIPLGGSRLHMKDSWPRPPSTQEMTLRQRRSNLWTGVNLVDSYYCSEHVPIRPRSRCLTVKNRGLHMKKRAATFTSSVPELATEAAEGIASSLPVSTKRSRSYSPQGVELSVSDSEHTNTSSEEYSKPAQTRLEENLILEDAEIPRLEVTRSKENSESSRLFKEIPKPNVKDITRPETTAPEESSKPETPSEGNARSEALRCEENSRDTKGNLRLEVTSSKESLKPRGGATLNQPSLTLNEPIAVCTASGEDLTPLVQLSLSKILLIEKLVKIIVKYNKRYYYHNVTRNGQTFITEVLQSLGVWENFKLGKRLEMYLTNLNKGRQEVYKSHKAVNDRVKYLIISGEIEEDTTYDEVRYLRSLYTIFHAEELEARAHPTTAVCSEEDCMLHALEEHLKKKRPDGATRLLPPENYM
jgi:hypothetical protein